jgi:hypothetical protein
MKKPKTAFLVYDAWRKPRRKDESFDGMSNIGAYMLLDASRRGGHEIEFCSFDSASKYDIVLVSLTSIYDVLAYAKEAFRRKDFKNRKFKVVLGGFGLQNPYPIQEYFDYAWFGRCEKEIAWLLDNNFDVEHDSLLKMPQWKTCKINQSGTLYREFGIGKNFDKGQKNDEFIEVTYGCPNNCFYCHYTWARKHIDTGKHYNMRNGQAQTLDPFNIEDYDPACAHLTIGIDGYSERLRYLYNRRVSNGQIKSILEHISHSTTTTGKAVSIKLFNITAMETETKDDKKELWDLLRGLNLKKKLLLVIHDTPLHPSPLTPAAYSPVNIGVETREHIGIPIVDTPLNNTFYSQYIETTWGLMESIVVERAQDSTQGIFMDIVFNKKLRGLKSKQKIAAISKKHDITPLTREYSTTEQLPTWFMESYTPNRSIKRMRDTMKTRINAINSGATS